MNLLPPTLFSVNTSRTSWDLSTRSLVILLSSGFFVLSFDFCSLNEAIKRGLHSDWKSAAAAAAPLKSQRESDVVVGGEYEEWEERSFSITFISRNRGFQWKRTKALERKKEEIKRERGKRLSKEYGHTKNLAIANVKNGLQKYYFLCTYSQFPFWPTDLYFLCVEGRTVKCLYRNTMFFLSPPPSCSWGLSLPLVTPPPPHVDASFLHSPFPFPTAFDNKFIAAALAERSSRPLWNYFIPPPIPFHSFPLTSVLASTPSIVPLRFERNICTEHL